MVVPNPDKMIATVHAYVAAFEAGSVDQIAALFATDATVEDPVGADVVRGIEAIRDFYGMAMGNGTRLVLDGPIRVTHDHAAFAFTVHAVSDGKELRVEVIDTFRFNDLHEIAEMRAYFGPVNVHRTD